jgi:hypothetical protein
MIVKDEVIKLRTVSANGTIYVRVEDIVLLLSEFAQTEDKDVRHRMNELANILLRDLGWVPKL